MKSCIGVQPSVPCFSLTSSAVLPTASMYAAYSGMSPREGWSWARKVTLSLISGRRASLRRAARPPGRRGRGAARAGGLELGQEGHALPHLRVALEHPAVGLEAADDVLGEVGPVHAQEELAWEPLYEFLLLQDGLACGEFLELRRVYGDGVGPHPHLASCVPHDTVLHVTLGAEDPGGGRHHVAGGTA